MPKVAPEAIPGMLMSVLAYHADEEIARAVATGKVVVVVVLLLIAIALLLRMRNAPTAGPNPWARAAALVAAVGIALYLLSRVLPDEPSGAVIAVYDALLLLMIAVTIGGPIVAMVGLGRVRSDGEPRLSIAAFVASLVLPGIFFANVYACAVTDACFH
jgi:cytochrome bd-type quinol oxidase subunit 2